MKRISLSMIGFLFVSACLTGQTYALAANPPKNRECVTSPAVRREIAQLGADLGAITQEVKHECQPGTVGRAQQAYFEFLSLSVDTGEVMDSLRSLVDPGQNHALAHDIAEYQNALERIDTQAKRAKELCSGAVGTSLTVLKRRYIEGDDDQTEDGAVAGLKRLQRVLDNDQDHNTFYQESPKGSGVSYYDKKSPFSCTLPRYGLAEFKTIFNRFMSTLKNFKSREKQIRAREGKILYQEFLTDQQLMSVQDFKKTLTQDERQNQVVNSAATSTQDGRASDRLRHVSDHPATLGGTLSRITKESSVARVGTEEVLLRTQARNEAYAALTEFVDEDAELVQRVNRQSGTHFSLYEALLDETDKIMKVDLCRAAQNSAALMVRACETISYCAGQVCDESEPLRSCSP